MDYNNLPLTEGTYVLMQSADRYDDQEFYTRTEAEDAIDELDEDDMWIGYVERINDQLEIVFVCGEQS